MLDESTSATPSSSAPDDGLPRPPKGRRAASRPAGPPEVLAGPAPTAHPILEGTPQQPAEIAAEKSAVAGEIPASPVAPGIMVTPENESSEQPTPDVVPQEQEPVDQASVDVIESPEEEQSEPEDDVAAAIAAVMREIGPKTPRSSRSEPAGAQVPETSAQSDEVDDQTAGSDTAEAEPAQGDEKPRPRRRRNSRRRTDATEETSPPQSQPEAADDLGAALAAAEKHAEASGRRHHRGVAKDHAENTGEAESHTDKDAVLESLVAVIAGESKPGSDQDKSGAEHGEPNDDDRAEATTTAEPVTGETDTEVSGAPTPDTDKSEVEADSDAEESETPHRRRRRRGGRRRRRSTDNGDSAEESSEDKTAEDSGEDNDQSESSETSGSQHRRRRRRRRHSEDGASDENSDAVVGRVHESGHNLADEVTGIEGSTRLEAKRQRRKQGRAAGRRRAPILSEAEFLARRESVDRKMVIRQRADYTQLAVLEDGVLVEHYVDRKASTSLIGNIYLGKVQNVLPSMEAAFIDIGRGRNAVLYAGEVNWDSMENPSGPHTIQTALTSGQTVLVQVTKDPIGAKGARLTAHISLPGRFVVYSPDGHLSGISRKLPDSERHRLKNIVNEAVEDSASVIVRTAAEGATEAELSQDVERLKAQWEVIQKKVAQGNAPQQLYAEPDLTLRIVRDLFTEDFGELVVAGNGGPEDAYETLDGYVEHVAPSLRSRLKRWDPEKGDPFAEFRVDEQISKALERKVFLPSGGSLVIDRTEAMNVIDVNTGKFIGSGGNLEETVTKNNLEAAEEIVRQMRLRDLGGIIVVDFIDMVLPANRELLLRRLVECLERDRTRHQVSEVTSLGLVQMTRKKIGTGLAEAFTEPCTACGGRGYVRYDEPVKSQAPADGGDRHRRGGRKSHSGK
ncbi:Rne/Rng family ribonuclease [Propionibacterium sp.]|uniref:Rne/Rng family ribonuclease n=1 Tax=Propionibacterium sp. TaxID=1977903 RepID=UPI0039EC6AA1